MKGAEQHIILDQSSQENFEIFKNDSFNITKIIGKPLKFFFILDNGYLPGSYWEDEFEMNEEAIRRCIPFDIREVNTIGPGIKH
tara:strand:+ start:1811 stop:2062 length:252 start_codon:yes stop_codon:yes gene_type:complete